MPGDAVTILVSSGDLDGAPWQLVLIGEADDGLDTITNAAGDGVNPARIRVRRVAVQVEGGMPAEPITLGLANDLDIPRALVKDRTQAGGPASPKPKRFKTSRELGEELTPLAQRTKDRFEALRDEALRMLSRVEARVGGEAFAFLGVATPFGHGQALIGTEIRLHLAPVVLGDANDPLLGASVLAEFAVVGKAKLGAGGQTVETRMGFTCVIGAEGIAPRLRIDLHDFHVSLPDLQLPSWSFPSLGAWPLSTSLDALDGAARALKRLMGAGKVKVTAQGAENAALAMRLSTGQLDWAVVNADVDAGDWDDPAELDLKLATIVLVIAVDGAAATATVRNVTLKQVSGTVAVTGEIEVHAEKTITVDSGEKSLGPLDVAWEGVTATLIAAADQGGPKTLRASVKFKRLLLALRDDPDAELAFAGEIELTASGARIVKLELVAPYPIMLVAKMADSLARTATSIITVVADFANATGEQVARLLDILARMAAAVGRAVVFVATEVADLLAKNVVAIAELVGELLRKLAEIAQDGASTFAVEARIATDPVALRQVLISLRGQAASSPRTLKALGFQVSLAGGWSPGLLIDLAGKPGAYLVLTRDAKASARIASISMDLWLKREGVTSSVRDAAGAADSEKGGERADKPMVEITLEPGAGLPDEIVVMIAGLQRGRPVFLKRFGGTVRPVPLPVDVGGALKVVEGPYGLEDFKDEDAKLDVAFDEKRILPLLGMGEPDQAKPAAPSAGPSFLEKLQQSLGNVVWVKRARSTGHLARREAEIELVLGLKAAGLETEVTLKATLSLDTFEVEFGVGNDLPIFSQRIEEHALGLVWVVEQADPDERITNEKVEMFHLGFAGAQTGFALNAAKARMELRFEGLSSDGKGIVFEVETLKVGPGGLDLVAKVRDEPVRLNGIDVPFRFTSGRLEIRGGRLVHAAAAGRGALPPALIGDAACKVALVFSEEPGSGIVLQSGRVELEKAGEPIVCHATRFTLTITDLDIGIVKDGGYHFFFLVTGSLRFTPKPGEFESGLLQFLDGVEMNLERTPLTADPRVLVKHISFQKTLNPKKTFNLFNLFTFELRGFGYHPASDKFGGAPAINLSGQISFAEIGDVMQPSIEFHGLWMSLPGQGEALPRIKADGLGVDLNLKGAIRVRGSVLALDRDTRTVEGAEYAPKGYDMSGFLGAGELSIPGFGDLSASLGFVELERQDRPGDRKKAFYLYAEKRRVAVEITTPIWVFYLREFGFGFGFRYTLEAMKAADEVNSVPQLVKALDEVTKRQGDLHKFSAWRPDPEGDKVTLAAKGVLQAYPAEKVYKKEREETAENPFLFDFVAAIRSDFTLFMGLRGWLGTNYHDYQEDTGGLRSNPGLRGYLYISAPQKRLLARAIGDSRGYIGERIEAFAKRGDEEPPLRRALRSVDWSVTLFIKPGLFHYELGWPNQLAVRLVDTDRMRVAVRGGMIFRAAEDGLLWGYNIEADAHFRFGGELQLGPVGVAAEATLDTRFVARVIAFISWRFKGSLVYGLIALDATLSVRFRAWLNVDLGFTSFTIRIRFELALQISAAVEAVISTEGVGARVDARVAVSVFGWTLSVSVGFALNPDRLVEARARVQRFLALSLTAEEPDAAPAFAAPAGDRILGQDAGQAEAEQKAPNPADVAQAAPGKPDLVNRRHAWLGRDIRETNFWLVLRKAEARPDPYPGGAALPDEGRDYAYALLVPKEAIKDRDATDKDENPYSSAFYAAPPERYRNSASDPPEVDAAAPVYTLDLCGLKAAPAGVLRWTFDPANKQVKGVFKPLAIDPENPTAIPVRWNAPVANDEGEKGFTLAHLLDECFLYDADWQDLPDKPWRKTTVWKEPPPRIHDPAREIEGATDEARVAARDAAQREHGADGAENPIVDAVHQARSTAISMFIEQFMTVTRTGKPGDPEYADVTDLGLVFYGPVDELEKLGAARIVKRDQPEASAPGHIKILNGRDTWFDRVDPVLAPPADRKRACGDGVVTPEGIKLAWTLELPFARSAGGENAGTPALDPEHFLEKYEILRTVENLPPPPGPRTVKRAATFGKRDPDTMQVALHASDWQFVDDLADLPAELRRALLPASDEAGALAAAVAWADVFAGEAAITLTYSVTPRDIAGAQGTPKGFVVVVPQPQPPIRAAEAELRFVVRSLDAPDAVRQGEAPADSLGVVMAMRDGSFLLGGETTRQIGGRTLTITRSYRLIADPEDIRPSGHYGTDGLTDRRLSPPSGFVRSADQLEWELTGGDFKNLGEESGPLAAVTALEPDGDTLKKFPLWRAIAGKTGLPLLDEQLAKPPRDRATPWPPGPESAEETGDFLQRLWTRTGDDKGARIATRFWLVTVQEVLDPAVPNPNDRVIARTESKPVPVPIEVRVEKRCRSSPGELGLSRPEAFEWPVHFAPPPLAKGQVRATSGFARFKTPSPAASFDDLLRSVGSAVFLVRDPGRRVLTQVSFDAAPAGWTEIHPMHRQTIAGYDLHELDIDDLARLDTTDGPGFARNASTWRRARRVARIERVSPGNARLTPADTKDWQGWQAHYPSETWRLVNRGAGRAGQAKPMRAPWYSPAESTIAFAERNPRLRFFPAVPEQAVQDLMRAGRPAELRVTLTAAAGSNAERTLATSSGLDTTTPDRTREAAASALASIALSLFPIMSADGKEIPIGADLIGKDTSGKFVVATVNQAVLDAPRIRGALLRLGWKNAPAGLGATAWVSIAETFRDDPAALDGLAVVIEGCATVQQVVKAGDGKITKGRDISTGTFTAPLTLSAFIHALIEEVLGELEYHAQGGAQGDQLYRRYVVTAQSVQPIEGETLDGFLVATAAEKDPYGWAALHQLGLAATVSLYDRDQDLFLDAAALGARVQAAMCGAVERYAGAYSKVHGRSSIGAPFVDVLLKPTRDRVPGPFDAVLKEGVEGEAGEVKLADDGLAMMQLSLRPVPVAGRHYGHVEMGFEDKEWPGAPIAWRGGEVPAAREELLIDGYELRFENPTAATYEVVRLADGAALTVAPGRTASLPLLVPPKLGKAARPLDPALTLQFRVERATALKPNEIIALVARVVRRVVDPAGLKLKTTIDYVTMEKLFEKQNEFKAEEGWTLARWTKNSFPLIGLVNSAGTADLDWVPIDSPQPPGKAGEQEERYASPYERFGALQPGLWSAMAASAITPDEMNQLDPGTPALDVIVRDAFSTLAQNLRRTAPRLDWADGVPEFTGLQKIVGPYLTWSQRFLAHGAAPCGAGLAFALAAPVKAQPWQLAADRNGRLTLSFLHQDRWAHARAYAVQPTGRYGHMAVGAGYVTGEESEQLVPAKPLELRAELGYALAVSPRTERIEPPVILGSRLVPLAKEHVWELVVARHGEESLAFSNRPLFARLGTEGTALAFVREYREPDWPKRLKQGFPLLKQPDLHPTKDAAPADAVPSAASAIDGDVIAGAARLHPTLWQGADILRVGKLLPHYRLTALAVARAGIVVSRVVTAVQDATPRRALPPLSEAGVPVKPGGPGYKARAEALLNRPKVEMTRDGQGPSVFRIRRLRMVAHADLAESSAYEAWLKDAGAGDVAWWPDPDVTYTLLRRAAVENQRVDDEEAVVNLVARSAEGGENEQAVPVIVRCRGTRFEAALGGNGTVIEASRDPQRPTFTLDVAMQLRANGSGAPGRLRCQSGATPGQRDAFRAATAGFAALATDHQVSVAVTTPPEDSFEEIRARARAASDVLHAAAQRFDAEAGAEPWPELAAALLGFKDEYDAIAAAADVPSSDFGELYRRLMDRRGAVVSGERTATLELGDAAKAVALDITATNLDVLTLTDLPPDNKLSLIVDSGHPIAAKPERGRSAGPFWRLARELLLGGADGFVVRAVDARNAIDRTGDGWIAPGEIETDVDLPDWAPWGRD